MYESILCVRFHANIVPQCEFALVCTSFFLLFVLSVFSRSLSGVAACSMFFCCCCCIVYIVFGRYHNNIPTGTSFNRVLFILFRRIAAVFVVLWYITFNMYVFLKKTNNFNSGGMYRSCIHSQSLISCVLANNKDTTIARVALHYIFYQISIKKKISVVEILPTKYSQEMDFHFSHIRIPKRFFFSEFDFVSKYCDMHEHV